MEYSANGLSENMNKLTCLTLCCLLLGYSECVHYLERSTDKGYANDVFNINTREHSRSRGQRYDMKFSSLDHYILSLKRTSFQVLISSLLPHNAKNKADDNTERNLQNELKNPLPGIKHNGGVYQDYTMSNDSRHNLRHINSWLSFTKVLYYREQRISTNDLTNRRSQMSMRGFLTHQKRHETQQTRKAKSVSTAPRRNPRDVDNRLSGYLASNITADFGQGVSRSDQERNLTTQVAWFERNDTTEVLNRGDITTKQIEEKDNTEGNEGDKIKETEQNKGQEQGESEEVARGETDDNTVFLQAAYYDDEGESEKANNVFNTANPDNFTYEHWLQNCQSKEKPWEHFLKSVLEPIFCVSGILGILLSMVVLSRKSMCTSCNCYLIALGIADLLFLIILSARSLVKQLGDCHYHLSVEKTIIDVYSLILMDTFQYLTVGVTVMLAVERYIAICHPMRAMTMCTVRRARTIICILTIIAFTLRAPKFFELDIGYVHISTGEAIFMVTRVYLYDEFLYTCIVTAGLLTILPLLSLMILNIRIIYEIRHSARYLRNFLGADLQVRSVVSSEELKITMMLISVVIAFFICHAPYMVFTLIMAFAEFNTEKNPELTNSEFTKYFKYVCTSLLILKASCNFILYCWFSEKFWATYKRIFCPMLCVSQQRSARRYPHSSNNNNHRSMWQQSSTTNFHRSSYYVTRETTC